uniref:RING-type domain-containing protein n=1 Tax=Setaria digitata TaxID=48799 RepID=A0A915Q2N4_9BILA
MLAQLRGLLCNVDLQSLVPKCGGCFENFDAFLRAPYILSCCHTLCLTCLTPQVPQRQQKRKRKCPICRAKYEKYTMNSALLTLIIEIREITICYQRSCIHCEQCGKQAIVIDTRRCRTCENVVHEMLGHPLQFWRSSEAVSWALIFIASAPVRTCRDFPVESYPSFD